MPSARTVLWSRREAVGAVVGCAVGGVALAVCWWGAAGERTFEDEKRWLIVAILAAAFTAVVAGATVVTGFRRLRTEKDHTFNRYLRLRPEVASLYLEAPQSAVLPPNTAGRTEVSAAR